tara:strand:- start:1098 stop:1706 length:609 start_codon:yes stop_codon:yes gene_type:complete
MSDYSIYSISSYSVHSVDLKFESVSNGSFTLIEEQSPSPNFPINQFDIIKVTITHNGILKFVYGVYQNQTYDGTDFRLICDFDSNVYGAYIQADTDVIKLEYYQLPATSIFDLNSYSLSPSLQVATYSKSFKAYNVTESYTITAPREKSSYDKDFRELYSITEKVLVDTCNNRCYKVSPTDLSAVAVNGRITTALNFNVSIK